MHKWLNNMYHIGSMGRKLYLYLHGWQTFMVNVFKRGKCRQIYQIYQYHGSMGYGDLLGARWAHTIVISGVTWGTYK